MDTSLTMSTVPVNSLINSYIIRQAFAQGVPDHQHNDLSFHLTFLTTEYPSNCFLLEKARMRSALSRSRQQAVVSKLRVPFFQAIFRNTLTVYRRLDILNRGELARAWSENPRYAAFNGQAGGLPRTTFFEVSQGIGAEGGKSFSLLSPFLPFLPLLPVIAFYYVLQFLPYLPFLPFLHFQLIYIVVPNFNTF